MRIAAADWSLAGGNRKRSDVERFRPAEFPPPFRHDVIGRGMGGVIRPELRMRFTVLLQFFFFQFLFFFSFWIDFDSSSGRNHRMRDAISTTTTTKRKKSLGFSGRETYPARNADASQTKERENE